MPTADSIIIDYEMVNYRRETQEFFHKLPGFLKDYFIGLLPIATWIHRYNLQVRYIARFFLTLREIVIHLCILVAYSRPYRWYNSGYRRCASEYGLRQDRRVASAVWSLVSFVK